MPEQTLPGPLVMAIGRVAVNGTRLEVDVTHTLWSALGHAAHVQFASISVPGGGALSAAFVRLRPSHR